MRDRISSVKTLPLLWAAFVACGGEAAGPEIPREPREAPPTVASVSITAPATSLEVGLTLQLTAAAKDRNGHDLTGRVISWSSSAASVATVSTSGLVAGIDAGTATITATSEGKQASVTIEVRPKVIQLTLRPGVLVKFVGDTARLKASSASGDVSADVTWSSSNEAVATISSAGLVTARGVGMAALTATASGASGSVTINVTAEPQSPADINAHFPFCADSGALKLCSDISPEFTAEHLQHLVKTWAYFASVFARSSGNYTVMHYTDDLYGLYQRIFKYCPSVVIPGGRNLTTCFDNTDRVYIWYVVPYIKPDFGTQLHEISHTFLYATYLAAETNVWLKEGTGMYYESGSFDASGKLNVTTPIPYIRDSFKRWRSANSLIPLQQLVTMTRDEFYGYAEPTKTYSQAGMLVFYLATQQSSTWTQLIERLNNQTIKNNTELLNFIATSTGMSVAQLEAAYLQYAAQF